MVIIKITTITLVMVIAVITRSHLGSIILWQSRLRSSLRSVGDSFAPNLLEHSGTRAHARGGDGTRERRPTCLVAGQMVFQKWEAFRYGKLKFPRQRWQCVRPPMGIETWADRGALWRRVVQYERSFKPWRTTMNEREKETPDQSLSPSYHP